MVSDARQLDLRQRSAVVTVDALRRRPGKKRTANASDWRLGADRRRHAGGVRARGGGGGGGGQPRDSQLPEYRLAALELGTQPSRNDPLVGRIAQELDVLSWRCREGRSGLGDLVQTAKTGITDITDITRRALPASLILRDLIAITDPSLPEQDCSGALAILTTTYGVQWRR